MDASNENPLVEFRNTSYGLADSRAPIISNLNFSVMRGETVVLLGESGCGKTTLGQTVIRLYEPTSGSINFAGTDISHLGGN
ncbi:MAG: ATP-binding cassette domain-containing protein, partial [Pyrinomonadaceae bacterium]